MDKSALRHAIRQQLESDRLLGLNAVPLPDRGSARSSPGNQRSHSAPTLHVEPALFPADVPRWEPDSPLSKEERSTRLRVLDESQVRGCTKCGLSRTRTQTVFGQGHPAARLAFVGEAPGFEEDRQGLAFVGAAGQLLTKMINAMGLTRDDVFICNVLKCRPPNNREPSADEILACSPYLREQLQTIRPEVIIALGAPAAKTLLNTVESIGRLRGRWHEYFVSGVTGAGPAIPLMPTYHPAYLLRTPGDKAKAWNDLQMVMARLGLPVSTKRES